ncbi:palmitoyl-protein thioesterase ABHD10, mitochondrial [Anolis carolinensis]|uniref:Palmitoyl-protein thioesterase ABHD10, mitochondrial n=1 Tax=Anolis carolinensis TaxID=28377 RepID=G1KQP8_ANOCA|nr:PREDICTED: mycophenolic acid acyl-glucuronide esterase, mitochondrial [Anolis carolinensis]|eukprot:XP_003219166.1 PREDICTED: mycophenolic acid acyl-glucuronide esterase, mitochondrial [Anolis carolinensis]
MALSGAARLLWREKLRWGPAVSRLGCRQKSSPSFLNRADLPKLAYHKLKGKNPGVVFLPGLFSNMNGEKALALEEYCKSVGHAFVRFDYRGCGGSDGNTKENTLGKWRKDVLSILDELTQGPQILVGSSLGGWLMLHAAIARPEKVAALVGVAVAADHLVATFQQLSVEVKKEIEEKGEWRMPTKHNEEGFYSVPYELIQEAENHCVLNSPLPIKCPVRLIHGLKDDDVPWQISMKIAECVVSGDVDIILRKGGGHRMKEKEDIKLIVYTVEDLIEQLST